VASSFSDQIPVIVYLLQQLKPRTVLDIGKGFGKYGFLVHEYVGVPTSAAPDPTRTLAQQSEVAVDAVEIQKTYLWPHIDQFYRKVFVGRIEELYEALGHYDVVLMADVIEHIEKPAALAILRHFLAKGSTIVIATPKDLFHQELYDSPHEQHVSHWRTADFGFASFVDTQNVGAGRIFLLANKPSYIRGFGNRLLTRIRRVARLMIAEVR
jgi:SAM-dependent methyltransferase